MQFRLTITTNNAAFEGCETAEIARILRAASDRIEAGEVDRIHKSVYDANGNTVGTYALKENWS